MPDANRTTRRWPRALTVLLGVAVWSHPGGGTPLANPFPRSFTDDPFVDDEKFIEIGKSSGNNLGQATESSRVTSGQRIFLKSV